MAYRIINLINSARTNPQETGARLYHNLKPTFKGTQMMAFDKNIDTFQGFKAVQQLKNYLSTIHSSVSLAQSPALNKAAQQIAKQKGMSGNVTNQHPKVINQKVKKNNSKIQGKVGSLICLRTTSPEQAVTQLLVDDGLMSRKRRRMLLDPEYKYIGVGSANHTLYGNIVVILLAQKAI